MSREVLRASGWHGRRAGSQPLSVRRAAFSTPFACYRDSPDLHVRFCLKLPFGAKTQFSDSGKMLLN